MKIRNLAILAVVVALLLVVKVVQDRSQHQQNQVSDTSSILAVADSTVVETEEQTQDAAKPMTATDLVNRVTIQYGDDERGRVVLERLDRWIVRSAWGHDADGRKVEELITSMIGMQGEFRSDSPDVLAQYGLGPDASPITLTLYGRDWAVLSSLEVGDSGSDGRGVFVRLPGRNVVFWTEENILAKAGLFAGPAAPENKHFLSLEVQSCGREDITEIRLIQRDGQDLTMRKIYGEPDSTGAIDRSTWDWQLVSPETRALSRTKVDGVLSALTNVKAVDVADPDTDLQSYGLMKAAKRVEYDLVDGRTFELRFGAARPVAEGESAETYMMSGLDTTIWVMRDFVVEQVFKNLDDLLPTE